MNAIEEKKMRILIVEDDPILALVMAEALEDQGHEVVGPAHDEPHALRLVEEGPLDVAFVDINLSGHEEGIRLAGKLRAEHCIASLYISGQVEAALVRGRESIGLLSKPYGIDDLLNTASIVQSWLAGLPSEVPIPMMLTMFNPRARE